MKKKRRRRVSLGTIFMILLTAVVITGCALFLTVLVGDDIYKKTGELIRSLSEQGMFERLPESFGPIQSRTADAVLWKEAETTVPVLPASTPTPVPSKSTMTIAVGGAVYAPRAVRESVRSGRNYDFSQVFAGVSSMMSDADLAIATLETTTAGAEMGWENYNAPPEILDALRSAGVDLFSLATERTLDMGYEGLDLTVSELTRRGLAYAGVNPHGEAESASMMRIGGIQVAVLAYTYGLSDEGMAKTQNDKRNVVSLLDRERMIRDITQARVSGANLVIVLPHWGTKNKQETPENLRVLAYELAQAGADLIVGTHPNVAQGTERLRVTRSDGIAYDAVVCYSVGALLTDARTPENTAGMIAQLDVTYDPLTRRTTLGELETVPVYIARQREERNMTYRVVDTQDEQATSALTAEEQAAAREAAERIRNTTLQEPLGGYG